MGIAVGIGGGVVLLLVAVDLFVTVFNYDGFTFLAGRLHALYWRSLRFGSRLLTGRVRAGYLSLGSAAMLPLTLLWWLALEVSGFAMMYVPGLAVGDFSSSQPNLLGPQAAFYLSGGDLTTLTFGDLVARAAPYRALVDLETVIGLATFTIGLTYVLAAFDALGSLNSLHSRIRRQTINPNRPASILVRHFHDGRAEQLPTSVQGLVEDLAAAPLPEPEFATAYPTQSDPVLRAFTRLREEAARATQRQPGEDPSDPELYRQYTEWLAFHERRTVVAKRLRKALCYDDDAGSGPE